MYCTSAKFNFYIPIEQDGGILPRVSKTMYYYNESVIRTDAEVVDPLDTTSPSHIKYIISRK